MLKKVFYYGRENNKKTILSIFLLVISIFCQTATFLFVYQVIDTIVKNDRITLNFLLLCATGVLISLILQTVFYKKGLDLSHEAAYGTLMNLRISLQGKLEKLPLGVVENKGIGTLKKVFVDDIDSLELLLAHGVPEGVSNLFGIIVIYLFLIFIDWKLALLAAITIPLGMMAMILMYSTGNKRMADYYKSGQIMNNTIIEYVNGMEVVKVFNKSGESYEKLKKSIINYRDFTLSWYKACWPLMAVYGVVLPCTLMANLPIGSWMVIKGYAGLSEYILVLCLSLSLGVPLLRVTSFMSMIPQVCYKIEELEKILDNPPLKEEECKFIGNNYEIKYENVSFGYDEEEVLHHINLVIKPDTKTAFVGESGSGKSTLAKLLVHYYDVKKGTISIGNQNICNMSLRALNNLVSYVSQDNFLFNMSLMENIRIGKPEATDEEVIEAARKAQCTEFIEKLPNGFYTLAGDCGNQLSGGEKQRITLARAILKNAPIIVLDEATAFADSENEAKIEAVLTEFVKGKTLIVIAHRLSTVTNADQIYVLKNGEVIERGTHQELLLLQGAYKHLWEVHQQSLGWQIAKEAKK